jgi:hypothetical protein
LNKKKVIGILRTVPHYGDDVKRQVILIAFSIFLSQALSGQSLVGTWISNALLLKTVGFHLTFRSDMTYEIDCSLGKTIGNYACTEDKIIFTPTSAGISAGSAGDTQVYYYTFVDDGDLYLHANGIKVKLTRTER